MNELIITDVVTLAALFLPTWISPVSSFTVLPVSTPKQKSANRHPPPPPDSPTPSSSSIPPDPHPPACAPHTVVSHPH